MPTARGKLEVEDLLKIVLLLVVVWIALEILEGIIGVLGGLLGLAPPLLGTIVVVLIVLWLLDVI
ncbi:MULTISPECIES: hypothetical protein [Halobacterium]|uniref:DUF7554 family protein n=1 Tax=Halobacterium TaxID=2239 RepID=UPI00073E716D|nr:MULTISPECIES: hypothetical protein [Halobacterium]MCG1004461.1 hypothetical protein [Halobacterium noricense]